MCPVIRISDQLYARLESHAEGFDTPSALIERLLDAQDGLVIKEIKESTVKPELVFLPSDEDQFKKLLISGKQASVSLHRIDGSIEKRIWKADKISPSSNIRGNLWSGILRGWKKKGIVKAELSI